VEIIPQPIVEKQLKQVPTSRLVEVEELQQLVVEDKLEQVYAPKPMEEKELQQPMNNGKEILQWFDIIYHKRTRCTRPRSW
jgi:hypothetical protein